jgi:hypothetical protein
MTYQTICIIIRNLSQQDSMSLFHKADIITGIEESDLLIAEVWIKQTVPDLHSVFHGPIPEGCAFEDIMVRVIDAEYVGIDVEWRKGRAIIKGPSPLLQANPSPMLKPSTSLVRVIASPGPKAEPPLMTKMKKKFLSGR